jgi:hypothetical protein
MPLEIQGSGKITGLTDPAADSDAARKKFVEDKVAEVETVELAGLEDVNTAGVNDGDILTYFDGEDAYWGPGQLPANAVDKSGDTMTGLLTAPNYYIGTTTASSDTIDIDFDEPDGFISRGVTGNIVFTGSNYVDGGIKSVRLVNGGTTRTVLFPSGWVFVGVKPTDLAANKTAIFTITSFGAVEGECVASWAVEF